MSNIYQLATDAEAKLINVAFSERVQKVVSALIAIEVLPLKRSEQHAILHNKFASLFVHALDETDGLITLEYTSSAYNSRNGLPSQTFRMLMQMQSAGFLTKVSSKSWVMSVRFRKIAGELTEYEVLNAA